MARPFKSSQRSRRSRSIVRHTAPRAGRPIVLKETRIVKMKHKHRHHGGGSTIGGLFSKERLGIMGGAFAVGFLEKQGFMQNLPKLPILGTLGTIGVGAYFLSGGGRNKLASDISLAAFVLAAHELAATGSIIGDGSGVDGGVDYVAGY